MNNIINKVELSKHSNVGTLSSTETNFSLYKDNVIEFNKTVDRPNDYYVEGDLIHFTIKMKNIGDKRIVNFTLKDELEECVKPFEGSYKVTTSLGEVKSYGNPVIVDKITLEPNQDMTVVITGTVSYM